MSREQAPVLMVIPTLGRNLKWLALTIDSIVSQEVPVDVRLVAPSTADVASTASRFGANIVRCDEPGLSRALNVGALEARQPTHRYLSWLGDDDLLAPGSLAATVRALDERPEAPFAFGTCVYIDPEEHELRNMRALPGSMRFSMYGSNLVSQPGSLIRALAWDQVGGIDESYKNAMDLDLFLRLSELGRPVRLNAVLAAWRIHDSSISSVKSDLSESERARHAAAVRRGDRLYPYLRPLMGAGPDRVVRGLMRRLPTHSFTAAASSTDHQ